MRLNRRSGTSSKRYLVFMLGNGDFVSAPGECRAIGIHRFESMKPEALSLGGFKRQLLSIFRVVHVSADARTAILLNPTMTFGHLVRSASTIIA